MNIEKIFTSMFDNFSTLCMKGLNWFDLSFYTLFSTINSFMTEVATYRKQFIDLQSRSMVFIYELNLLSNLGVPPETLKQLFKKKKWISISFTLKFPSSYWRQSIFRVSSGEIANGGMILKWGGGDDWFRYGMQHWAEID